MCQFPGPASGMMEVAKIAATLGGPQAQLQNPTGESHLAGIAGFLSSDESHLARVARFL